MNKRLGRRAPPPQSSDLSRDPSLSRRVSRFVDTLVIALLLLDAVAFLAGHGADGGGILEVLTGVALAGFALLVHLWLGQASPGLDRAGREDTLLRPDHPGFPVSPRRRPPDRPDHRPPEAPDPTVSNTDGSPPLSTRHRPRGPRDPRPPRS